ncbi:MAG: hypothetical protein AAGE84_23335 [Cyanobacteria bacterium P01_G01_bin.39]
MIKHIVAIAIGCSLSLPKSTQASGRHDLFCLISDRKYPKKND